MLGKAILECQIGYFVSPRELKIIAVSLFQNTFLKYEGNQASYLTIVIVCAAHLSRIQVCSEECRGKHP